MTLRYRRSPALLLLLLPLLFAIVVAQFGISKPKEGPSVPDHILQEQQQQQTAGNLSEQDAADIETLMQAAQKDPETQQMISQLKTDMSSELLELKKLSQEEILGGLKHTLDNLKLLDYLFKDPERAFVEMKKEGMIEESHVNHYEKNPDLLEQDTRKGLYFQFVSLAVVGGYL